jgi:TolB protein
MAEVPVGRHSVQLAGVFQFCAVSQPVLFAEVLEGAVSSLDFTVACSPAPTGQIMFQGFTHAGQSQVVTVNPDGSSAAVVLSDAAGPAWSHDRQRIAFLRDGDLYATNMDGSKQVQLTHTPESEGLPRWSPDDSKLLFYRSRGSSSPFDVYVIGADGAGEHAVFGTPDRREGAAWSPDGRKIVFPLNVADVVSLWIANPDGSGARRLTTGGIDVSPAWSPDGQRIAYRHADGPDGQQTEIYVIPANGGTSVNLTRNPAFEFDPEWSPDGQWIVFIAERNAAQALWIMRSDGSNARMVSNPAAFQFTSSPSWR